MRIWHNRLLYALLGAVETHLTHGWEVDSMLTLGEQESARLHVAEVLSRAAAARTLVLPPTDPVLLYRLGPYRVPVDIMRGGTVTATADGRVGYNIGDGRTIESIGPQLALVNRPDPTRYARQYTLPGVTHT